ncbi:MAG TPA: GWxTD domain-containing protein [Terracidiphilus sp.]|nr:GWxTD domain-containing protein [Terracidiphilus sp.]
MILNGRTYFLVALSFALAAVPANRAFARQHDPSSSSSSPSQDQNSQQANDQDQNADPLKRPLSDEQLRKAQKEVRTELKGAYKTWLDQDVAYIITDEERKAFKNLSNDEEREAFIEAFWARRNPNPDSPDNEFREEHYRRIAYANEHFAAGKPGWKTDRGRIYIEYGKPDSIDSHPAGGIYNRPMDEGGGETATYPFEDWHYRYLPGIGENVDIEFVDSCMCGDYHFTIDRGEKDALLHVPGMGLTQWEMMGMAQKKDRFENGFEHLGTGPLTSGNGAKEFDRLELAAKLFAPPPVKFKDLDAFISEHKLLSGPIFPFDVRTDFVKVTDSTVLVPITLQIRNRDITFVTRDGVAKGLVNILGKVTTITHRIVQTFEDTVQVEQPAELLEKSKSSDSVYWKALPLPPGHYRLDIAIKDVNNPDHVGIYGRALDVPEYHDEQLATSSLILADKMNSVDLHSIGSGNFVIGNTFIRPRVSDNPSKPVSFKRDQPLNFWMQVYNLGINEATKSNEAQVVYQIVDAANGAVVFQKELQSKDLDQHSDQLTVEKTLPIAGLQPGRYKVIIKVNDEISKQEIAQSAPFVVE